MEKRIDGATQLICLIGSPVKHSGSPLMHNFCFRHNDQNFAYMAFEVKEEDTKQALEALRLLGARGCNATMPCKTATAKAVDELSPAAQIIGACNTVVNENGKLIGHITDGTGFVCNLRENDVEVKDQKIVVIGAGGAATAIAVECALEGCKSLVIFNRTVAKAEAIAEKIQKAVPGCEVKAVSSEDKAALKEEILAADILINGTSIGMAPNVDATPVEDTSAFHEGLVVADAIYNPLETRLLREAKEAGCKIVTGDGMLLWQGAAAYKLWTGTEMPVEEFRKFKASL